MLIVVNSVAQQSTRPAGRDARRHVPAGSGIARTLTGELTGVEWPQGAARQGALDVNRLFLVAGPLVLQHFVRNLALAQELRVSLGNGRAFSLIGWRVKGRSGALQAAAGLTPSPDGEIGRAHV
jgi:hypothetical protein